jgi:chemotaxis protein MotA
MQPRLSSVIGTFLAILFLALLVASGQGPSTSLLWNPFGFFIVLCGTLIATLLSHQNIRWAQILHSVKGFYVDDTSTKQACKTFLDLAQKVRTESPIEVEKMIQKANIPFLRSGLQLIIDNASSEDITKILTFRIVRAREAGQMEADLFHSAANYSPAFGMLGTLIGLLGMLSQIGSGDLSQIGLQMAIALVTTFYGIILANLFFRPIAVQLERRIEHQVFVMRVLAESVLLLNMGKSVTQVKVMLGDLTNFYLDELDDAA